MSERGASTVEAPAAPALPTVEPAALARWLQESPDSTVVIDVTTGASYARRHIPGAWFAIRSQLAQALSKVPAASRYVLTCGTSALAPYAAADLRALLQARGREAQVLVLQGGNTAWFGAGLPVEVGESRLAVPRTDRYRRPYEGTDAPAAAMQAYLDWEFGLIGQLSRDGTHHFQVI